MWLLFLSREEEDAEAKARRVVRSNNFTQQTNALDVDKHMYVFFLAVRPLPWDWRMDADDDGW